LSEPALYVIAAPSGGGKTSLIRALLEKDDRVTLSVSHTTRPARPGEQDGVHYHFVSDDEFQQRVEAGEFLEFASVFDHRYGTGRKAVQQQLEAGFDVLLDIDWQGARQIRETFPGCVSIFIVPPSLDELRNRLSRRGQDSADVIARRMRDARSEISHWDEFDFLVVNDEFEDALDDLQAIIRTGRAQRRNQDERNRKILADLLKNR
jgi:guanylate kinase